MKKLIILMIMAIACISFAADIFPFNVKFKGQASLKDKFSEKSERTEYTLYELVYKGNNMRVMDAVFHKGGVKDVKNLTFVKFKVFSKVSENKAAVIRLAKHKNGKVYMLSSFSALDGKRMVQIEYLNSTDIEELNIQNYKKWTADNKDKITEAEEELMYIFDSFKFN